MLECSSGEFLKRLMFENFSNNVELSNFIINMLLHMVALKFLKNIVFNSLTIKF